MRVRGGGPDPARRARHDEETSAGNRGLFKFFAILAAGLVAIFGTIAFTLTYSINHSEVYETTWAAVQADPRVVAVTGAPVTSTSPNGSINVTGSDGTATVSYEVSGPQGRGSVEAIGTKTVGRWTIDRFVFRPDGDAARSIDLAARPR